MFKTLEELISIIRQRRGSSTEKSYTSKLLSDKKLSVEKVKEEVGELIEAIEKNSNKIHEASDVLYHLMVLLEGHGIKIEDVMEELKKRQNGTKSTLKMIRRKGDIPAIVYKDGKESLQVIIDGAQFYKHLREMKKGCISTVRFNCSLEGESFSAIIKDISYHRTTYNVMHVDLFPIDESRQIRLNIPVLLKLL